MKNVLVAVAWPYVNAPIHEGHPPGYLIPADIFARYQRLVGNDVLMVSGSDAHGTPNTIAAEKRGITPAEQVDGVHLINLKYWDKLGISYDLYTKTSNEFHKKAVQNLFLEIYNNGYMVKKKVKYYYSEIEKKALLDRFIEGECPYCHYEKARGDQCDYCGKTLTPFELIDPYSIYGDTELKIKEGEDYFLDLAKLQKDLENYLSDKDNWKTHVLNFTKAWLDEGLRERSITRDLNWGVEIPEGIEIEGKENKRIYVWFDAVSGYLTASQAWSAMQMGTHEAYQDDYMIKFDHKSKDWKDWWFDKDSDHVYFMGKDNIPFHTIIWPGMLIAANITRKKNEQYQLPSNVPANNYMNLEGQKISKSRNWMIGLDYLTDNYDSNLIRYYFTIRMPENKDSDFQWKDFIMANNNELVATLGNFIHRVLMFTKTNFDSQIPEGELDDEVKAKIVNSFLDTGNLLDDTKFAEAIGSAMELAKFGNKYFNDSEVWKVIKTNRESAGKILYNCFMIIFALRTLFYPFLPDFSNQLSEILNLKKVTNKVDENRWNFNLAIANLVSGHRINEPKVIFAKIDEERIEEEVGKLGKR